MRKFPVTRALIAGVLVALFALPVAAEHSKTDVVTTDDGNPFIGEIKNLLDATLQIKTDAAGTLDIEWRRVTGVVSEFDYRVELSNGDRVFGSLVEPLTDGSLRISNAAGDIEIPLEEVFMIVPVESTFLRRLNGSVNFGFTYTQSNSSLQYNLNANANYRTRRNYMQLDWQSIFNRQNDGPTTNQNYIDFYMAQVGKEQWGVFELLQFQANPDQGYDQRYIAGAGAIRFFVENSMRFIGASVGAVYNREYVTGSTDVNESAEALLSITLRRFKQSQYAPTIQAGLQLFPSLTESSRLRGAFNFNISWKLFRDFIISFQVNDYYDSSPPADCSRHNDVSVVSSVGYSF